jgi:hypothetical protein
VQAFQQGLRDLGWVEGRNIRIEYRYTDVALQGPTDMFARLAVELIRLKPDVLVSITEAALAARNATSTIPIVMVSVPDPVASGLVASLGRPGGNVTGLSRQYDERGWRATFYTTGMEHSPTSATGTGWERTPWHAAQRAAWEALKKADEAVGAN